MLEWLQTKVFNKVVQAQAFGTDVKKFVSFESETGEGVDRQFTSDITFGGVIVQKDGGELHTESVVIKIKPAIYVIEAFLDVNAQFHNEVLFYSTIVPLFRKYDTDDILSRNFAEFIYGIATNGHNPKEDVIIFKNLHKKGFKLADEKVFLDKKHIKLALNVIAKFHALSIKCQWNEPTAFQEVVAQIKSKYKCNYEKDSFSKGFHKQNTFRGIDALRGHPKYEDKLDDISRHCEDAYYWLRKYEEPSALSVITHGDFCRNNMMFRYDGNGDPVDVVFFDLQTIKFCSPIIDTSLLLLLNTLPETRRLHSDDFLCTYYDSLSGELDRYPAELSRCEILLAAGKTAKPSFDTVELEWRSKGVHGYYFAAFFLPMMLAPDYKNESKEAKKDGSFDKLMDSVKELGGPQVTIYLAEIVKHMLDKGYIFEH